MEDLKHIQAEWKQWCLEEYEHWKKTHPVPMPMLYNPRRWFKHLEEHQEQWRAYITPLTEAKLAEYGLKPIWPADDSQPIRVVPLE